MHRKRGTQLMCPSHLMLLALGLLCSSLKKTQWAALLSRTLSSIKSNITKNLDSIAILPPAERVHIHPKWLTSCFSVSLFT